MANLSDDERLRRNRLVFYEEDIARIDQQLDDFLGQSKAKCALLIDKEGHMVTVRGGSTSYNTDTISALVAGSFAATREMARVLGEEEFSLLLHQGKKDNIQLSLIGDRTLLVAIFDETTTLGMVKLYSAETTTKLERLFEERSSRDDEAPADDSPGDDEAGDEGYAAEAQQQLDDLFGDE